MPKDGIIPQTECRREHCICAGSNEITQCLMGQWNEFDRHKEEQNEQDVIQEFKTAVTTGDISKAQSLLPEVKFKW